MIWMETKAWYTSKTVWLGVITAVVGGLEALAQDSILTDSAKAWAFVIVGMLTILLRAMTNTQIGKAPE